MTELNLSRASFYRYPLWKMTEDHDMENEIDLTSKADPHLTPIPRIHQLQRRALFDVYEPGGPQVDSHVHVTAVHVASPDEFYAVPKQWTEAFDYLANRVALCSSKYFQAVATGAEHHFTVGSLVLTTYLEDDLPYRGVILQVDPFQAVVQFIDFGNVTTVETKWLLPLPTDLMDPVYTLKLKLNTHGFVFNSLVRYNFTQQVQEGRSFFISPAAAVGHAEVSPQTSCLNVVDVFEPIAGEDLRKIIGMKPNTFGVQKSTYAETTEEFPDDETIIDEDQPDNLVDL